MILLLVGQHHTRLRPVDVLELGHKEDDGSGADEYHLGRYQVLVRLFCDQSKDESAEPIVESNVEKRQQTLCVERVM